jgi:sec-independent protein translocase protein TatB
MFEISWSELLILAVVALIFIGPKDLPVFFNTLGRYAGAVRRQANEFRRHFEDAMREAEMENLRKEFDGVREDLQRTARETAKSIEDDLAKAKSRADDTAKAAGPATPSAPEAPAPAPLPAAKPGV